MIVGLWLWGVCMLLATACCVVAYTATVAPSREWDTLNGGVRPPVFFYTVVVDIPDVVTYTNFGDHRLRGFWVAGGQISPSPIDFHGRPYNTLALPCERVITQ